MKNLLAPALCALFFIIASAMPAAAYGQAAGGDVQAPARHGGDGRTVFYSDPYEGFNEETFMDMDFEPNIATPVVPDAEKGAIRAMMEKVRKSVKGPFSVELTRDGEVLLVTVPTDALFLPGDTLLMESAERLLNPLFALMTDPMRFKVVAAVHTDDTGNELYRERLSTSRLYSVYDLFLDMIDDGKINPDVVIIPYAMGADDPIVDNDTRRNRAQNRRLELFFIPGPAMIEQAHGEVTAQKKKQ